MFEDKRSLSREEKRIRQQASEWLVELDEGCSTDREEAFEAWKSQDIRHEIATRDLEASWNRMKQLRQVIDDPTLRPNLEILTQDSRKKKRQYRKRWSIFGSIAALFLLSVGVWLAKSDFLAVERVNPIFYATTFNDYKQIGLEDGSILEMNANSRVEVAFTDKARRIKLHRGEAHFDVVKDISRPFLVDAGAVAVKAVGTAFNVRYDSEEVQVLVTEGRVAVNASQSSEAQIEDDLNEFPTTLPELKAGDQATISTHGSHLVPMVSNVTDEEFTQILAWKGPRLFFDATPLEEAVRQFNEHNHIQLSIDGEHLRKLSIGGSFLVEDVEAFVRLLAGEGSVLVERPDFNTILLKSSQ